MRASRRFRSSGWVVLVTLALVLLAAWNTGTNLLYIVVGGLCSFLIISLLLAGWSLRRLQVFREGPEAVHRDERFPVTIRVENHKRFMSAMSIRVDRHGDYVETCSYAPRIPPRRSAVLRVSERFTRRGIHALPPIVLASAFPFGLVERRLPVKDQVEVVVYPRIRALRPAVLQQLPGSNTTPHVVRGEGDEFFSLRDYVPGDDVRQIAWRVSARKGELVVKEFAHEMSRYVAFVLDTQWAADLENQADLFEEAVELTASLAVTFLNRQYSCSITTRTGHVPEGQGSSQARKMLDFLARVDLEDAGNGADFSWFVPKDEQGRARYVFVSSDPREWGRPCGIAGARVIDPREMVRA